MNTQRFKELDRLFCAALALDTAERDRYLDAECAADPRLRADVERLLRRDADPDSRLKTPPGGLAIGVVEAAVQQLAKGKTPVPPWSDAAPHHLGSYRIVRKIGEGGMGVVYLAEQSSPRRAVALKVMRQSILGDDATRRFELEQAALARLQHPGIARIYDAGWAEVSEPGGVGGNEGRGASRVPYFAMEHIAGLPLTEYADRHGLDWRARVDLTAQLADAIEHAHARGVIHRDLKPSNILVDERGRPVVLDFGIARLLDRDDAEHHTLTHVTATGQFLGTLAYMSPEQLGPSTGRPDTHEPIDAQSDVYALGVILYELISGRAPFDVAALGLADAVRAIRENDPEPLRATHLGPRFPAADLKAIVDRAMEKDRARRYPSAGAFGADLRRLLAEEPVHARPASRIYRARKFARRHRGLVWGTFAVFLALVGGIITTSWQAVRASGQAARADAAAKTANEQLTNSQIDRARLLAQRGNLFAAEELLWPIYFKDPSAPVARWALWEAYTRQPCLESVPAPFLDGVDSDSSCVSPDGRTLALGGNDGSVHFYDLTTSRWLDPISLAAEPGVVIRATTYSHDGTALFAGVGTEVVQIDLTTHAVRATLRGHRDTVAMIVPSPNGTSLVTAGRDRRVLAWSLAKPARKPRTIATWEDRYSFAHLAISPDGARVVPCDGGLSPSVLDLASGRTLFTLIGHTSEVGKSAFSPDGALIATAAGGSGEISLWNAATGAPAGAVSLDRGPVYQIAFTADSGTLMVCSRLGVQQLNVATKTITRHLQFGASNRQFLQLSGERELVTIPSLDHGSIIQRWSLTNLGAVAPLALPHLVSAMALSPDAGTLAVLHGSVGLSVVDLRDPAQPARTILTDTGPAAANRPAPAPDPNEFRASNIGRPRLAFHPTRPWLAVALPDEARLIDLRDGRVLASWRYNAGSAGRAALAMSPDGTRLAVAAIDGEATIWRLDPSSDTPVPPTDATAAPAPTTVCSTEGRGFGSMVFTPDSDRLVLADRRDRIHLWDLAAGTRSRVLKADGPCFSISIRPRLVPLDPSRSSDSMTPAPDMLVATPSRGSHAQHWNLKTGAALPNLITGGRAVAGCAHSPDGTLIVLGCTDGEILFFDAQSGERLASFEQPRPVRGLVIADRGSAESHPPNLIILDDQGHVRIHALSLGNRCIAGNEIYQRSRLLTGDTSDPRMSSE